MNINFLRTDDNLSIQIKDESYIIIGVGLHTETKENLIIYASCKNYGIWVEPLDIFLYRIDPDTYSNIPQEKGIELLINTNKSTPIPNLLEILEGTFDNYLMGKHLLTGVFVRHFKGGIYRIITVATNVETKERMMVYMAYNKEGQIWIRPLDMFLGDVDHEKYPEVEQEKRFVQIDVVPFRIPQ